MDYEDIKKYYGKTALIWHSLGVLMFDNPVMIFPEKDQGKRRRYYLHVLAQRRKCIHRIRLHVKQCSVQFLMTHELLYQLLVNGDSETVVGYASMVAYKA